MSACLRLTDCLFFRTRRAEMAAAAAAAAASQQGGIVEVAAKVGKAIEGGLVTTIASVGQVISPLSEDKPTALMAADGDAPVAGRDDLLVSAAEDMLDQLGDDLLTRDGLRSSWTLSEHRHTTLHARAPKRTGRTPLLLDP